MAKRLYTGTVEEYFIFCAVQQKEAGNALAEVWDFDTGGADTFNIPPNLSDDGQTLTHIGVSTLADAQMKQGIEDAIVQGTPWLIAYKKSDGYTWETALITAGLQEGV